jgi:crotonobetainyl-CoA:carnitine CoA-transferase CaiB-like acyl-CoA transferase
MSFAQFRTNLKRARNRRRLYARIGAMPHSTVREELIAIAQRAERNDSHR